MGKMGGMPGEDREKLDRMRAKAVFRAMVKCVALKAPAGSYSISLILYYFTIKKCILFI